MLLFPILVDFGIIAAFRPEPLEYIPKTPCCLESLGVKACNKLKHWNPVKFEARCTNEADFAIFQCCHSCNTNLSEFGQRIFVNGTESDQCFDRAFCGGPTACSQSIIAFRTCRETCGFCDPTLYSSPSSNIVCPFIG